ncbi:dihydrofolate reductase isoform X1 [Octopus vulgaris]|uniref:dihydrofolate reductase n=1 Tax=Octopus vulgaris TaxID=6645 RepID=A0AA36B6H2_OCTVU|nr:dihydrofolate reductase isoform X1 [Octopus vulgaris]
MAETNGFHSTMNGIKLNMIVAMCKNRGIGCKNKIPWRLKKEMAFFSFITKKSEDPDKQNVVVMGRKTYEGIPKKFFPLANRINIILSKSMPNAPEGAHLARDLKEAIDLFQNGSIKDKVNKLFIIGGSGVYQEVLESNYDIRLYLTRIHADFDVDVFFPEFESKQYKELNNVEDVPSEEQEENGTKWTYHVYERC